MIEAADEVEASPRSAAALLSDDVAATRLQAMHRGMSARSLIQSNRDMKQETREAKRLLSARRERARLEEDNRAAMDALKESEAELMEQENANEAIDAAQEASAQEAAHAEEAARAAAERAAAAGAATAAMRAAASKQLEEARNETAKRHQQRAARLRKLRQAAQAIIAVNHMTVAAAATRYGFVGLASPASQSLINAICRAKNAPNEVVSLAAAFADGGALDASRMEDADDGGPAASPPAASSDGGAGATADDAATAGGLIRQHGRKIRVLASWQEVLDASDVILLDLPVATGGGGGGGGGGGTGGGGGATADAEGDVDPSGQATYLEVLQRLEFDPGRHTVISLVPTLTLATLHKGCAPVPPLSLVRTIPLEPVLCRLDPKVPPMIRGSADQDEGSPQVLAPQALAPLGDGTPSPHASTMAEELAKARAAEAAELEAMARTHAAAAPLSPHEQARAAATWGATAALSRAGGGAMVSRAPQGLMPAGARSGLPAAASHLQPYGGIGPRGAPIVSRLAFATSVVQGSVCAPLPPLASALLTSIGAISLDVFTNVFGWEQQGLKARGATATTATSGLPGAAAAVAVAGEGSERALLLPELDTEESKPYVCQGLPCPEERCVALALPHGELCAHLLFDLHPDRDAEDGDDDAAAAAAGEGRREQGRPPTEDERTTARDVLLPLYNRGLPPLLRAVEAAGKQREPFHWAPKAEFAAACRGFAEDYLLPPLHALPAQAPISARYLQLVARGASKARRREAAAAHARQLGWQQDLAQARAAATALPHSLPNGVRPPLRTTNDQRLAERASAEADLAEERRVVAETKGSWGAAATAARQSAACAEAAVAAYRYPAVGSRVIIEEQRRYLAPERWEGIVVRHARSQNALAVQAASGAVRLISLTDGTCRIVEVAHVRR